MRTRIALGLFALTLGILANSALAGDVSECDVLTDPDDPQYAPKLYGLCVAWHNANENVKPALAARFSAHAEKLYGLLDFEVPGSGGLSCPCWSPDATDEFTEDYICSHGAPSIGISTEDFVYIIWPSFVHDQFGPVEETIVVETFAGFEGCGRSLETSPGIFVGDSYDIPLEGEAEVAGKCLTEARDFLALAMSSECNSD